MTRRGLYLFSASASVVGYVWLLISYLYPGEEVWTGCLFKKLVSLPCPSCGSTRSILTLCHGDLKGSLLLNPNGAFLALLMLIIPLWIIIDGIKRKDSYYCFYTWMEKVVNKRGVYSILIGLVIMNWFWNIYKNI